MGPHTFTYREAALRALEAGAAQRVSRLVAEYRAAKQALLAER